MPMGIKDMANFEILKNVHLNVFRYDNRQLFSLCLSEHYDSEITLDLLLLQDDQMYLCVFTTNILSLVNHIKQRRLLCDNKLCRICFHNCLQESFIDHHNDFVKFEAAAIEMPASNADKLEVKTFNARAYAPIVANFDLESVNNPILSCDDNPSGSWTCNLKKHANCGFCLVFIEGGSLQPVHNSNVHHQCACQSPMCMQKVAIQLQANAKEFHQKKQTIASTKADRIIQVIKLPTVGFMRRHFLKGWRG